MKALFLSLLLTVAAHAAAIHGVVRDAAGQPLAGAIVTAGASRVTTDVRGAFTLDVAAGATVHVAKSGFQAADVAAADPLDVTLRPVLAEAIVVSGIRATDETPVTKTDVTRADIERDYHAQDVPLMLRDTPSVDAYAESGLGGAGYSYISLRGIGPTRLNFTLDGVPLADSEDMGTYFADFPDLAHSLQSIQVQRGVGTSTVGSPSFGGSVSLESIALAPSRELSAEVAAGSFGSRLGTVGYQTGELPGGIAAYVRVSSNQSEGFRRSSGMRGQNLFLSAAKQNDDSQLRFTGFAAHEWTQQSFLAADADTLKSDLRANPMSSEDRDGFGYEFGQLQWLRALRGGASLTASAFFQRGYGWYELWDDETTKDTLRHYGLDGTLIGSMVTLSTTHGPLAASYGVHVNEFRRDHWRDVVGGARDYANYGTKSEANAFAKATLTRGAWHYYGDAQLRTTAFHYHGDVAVEPIRWTFFNPKIGARYDVSPSSGLYASAGMSTREPTRNDLFQGEDNASFAHDLHAVRPERLVDIEAGWDWRGRTASIAANVYAMEFRHEIASTGQLSDIGLLLRRNADRSYRRGIELQESWQLTPMLRLRGNATLSHNRIRSWTQYYDVYDAEGNYSGSEPLVHRNVAPLLTPEAIVNQTLELTPSPRWTAGVTGRYVAKSYLDNTNNDAFVAPSFTMVDLSASYELARGTRVRAVVNNLTNNRRVFPSGYSYLYLTPGNRIEGISYYYPLATRNATVLIDVTR